MQDDLKSELYETALFKKFKEQISKENELFIYNNTHCDKMYRALPCTIRQKKIQDNPIVMVQMLSKIQVKEEQLRSIDFQPKKNQELFRFPRFQTPTKYHSPTYVKSSVNSYRKKGRKINLSYSKEFETNEKQTSRSKDKNLNKKAELIFSSNLRNLLKSSGLKTLKLKAANAE